MGELTLKKRRRKAREAAMQLLYAYGVTGEMGWPIDPEEEEPPAGDEAQAEGEKTQGEGLPAMIDIEGIGQEGADYIGAITGSMPANREQIDEIISLSSRGWKIDRISKVDLAILRLALIEILFMDDIPEKVSVNEAVELAKKYSGEKSYKYVNGLLGAFLKEREEKAMVQE